MADIFREVDEEVRRDQAVHLWKKYGNYVIAAAVLIVLATSAVVGWREYSKHQRQAEGARFEQATELLRAGKWAEAAEAYRGVAAEAGAGYRALARLRTAAAQLQAGNTQAALAEYESLAADTKADAVLRDLASLLAVLNTVDTAPPEDLLARLAPLADGFGPWKHAARDLTAAVMIRQGNLAGATKLLQELSEDATAPLGVRGRAASMLAALQAGKT